MKFEYTLTGVSPLLHHKDDVELSDLVKGWQKDPSNKNVSVAGDDRTPPWLWQTYLYNDGEHVAVPTDNISAMLRMASARMILKGNKTFKELSQCGLFMEADYLKQRDENGVIIALSDIEDLRDLPFSEQKSAADDLGFALFIKRAKVGANKHVRVRPRFNTWTLNGAVDVTAKEITESHLKEMFAIAGFYIGLCDWRPGTPKSPGRFGRFDAKIVKIK